MNEKAKQPCPKKDSLDLSIVLSILDGSSEMSEDEIDALIRSIRTAIAQGSSKPKNDRITPYIRRDNLSGIRNGRSKKQPTQQVEAAEPATDNSIKKLETEFMNSVYGDKRDLSTLTIGSSRNGTDLLLDGSKIKGVKNFEIEGLQGGRANLKIELIVNLFQDHPDENSNND